MARLDPAWNDAHLAAIARLESDLGRVVCGAPIEGGAPCPAPVEGGGRCAAHAAPLSAPVAARPDSRRLLLWIGLGIALALLAVGVAYRVFHDPAEEIWREAASLTAMGESARARPLLELLARDYADRPAGARARVLLGHRSEGRTGSPAEKLFHEARNFYPLGARSTHDLEEAVTRYLALADSHPADPLVRDALYEAANALDHLGRPDETVRTWERFIAAFPDDGRVPEALYAIGHLYQFQLAQPVKARERLAELIQRFPESNAAAAARLLIEADVATAPPPPPPSGPPTIYTTPGRLR
jgi:tetratricopeptide (TPR) repeat protein